MGTISARARGILGAVLWYFLGLNPALAGAITYDFDTFADNTVLASQYAGLAFTNGTVLRAGIGLNEVSFPPRSGDGVLFDDGGAISIEFATLASSVSGYFTYADGLTLSAYDSGNNLIATATAAYLSNVADGSGDPGSVPNELLGVSSTGDLIARIVISSSSIGGFSLVLDDLTVVTQAQAVPEPGSLPLVMLGMLPLVHLARLRRR
jgi:hypothetical protein